MAARNVEIKSENSMKELIEANKSSLVVVYFWAPWAAECQHMSEVLAELRKDIELSKVIFATVEAEAVPDISLKYNISAVPTFIFIKNSEAIDRIDGAKAAELSKKVKSHFASCLSLATAPKQDLNTRLKNLITSASVMLFMKGVPEEPKCGFSRQIINILNERKVVYNTFNILADDEIRQGLKKYSDWPTYPQLYVNGELLGGLDIVKEMAENGDLDTQLPKA